MTEDAWVPLALSSMIEVGTSAGAVVQGQEIVVWRDSSGVAHTWEDRCPHRGMKMSFGFVRGDHIACLYHGWEYDQAGQCRYIPAHPQLEVPKTICVKTWAVAEAAGMIWVALGAAPPPPAKAEVTALRSLYLDAPLAAVLAALPEGFGGTLAGQAPLVTLDTDLGTLRIGVQPIDARRTALHLTVAGPATPDTLLALATRSDAFRLSLETAGAAA